MPMNRFWSSFWTVAGFLFLLGWLQGLADMVLGLFGLVELVSGLAAGWILLISAAVVPVWGALTFIDWRWGWKPDNAGLRTNFPAVFWLFPGLLAGAVAAGLAHLINGGGQMAAPGLSFSMILLLAVLTVQIFASELVYRGAVISRLQSDLSGRDLLILVIGFPFAWTLIQMVIGRILWISPVPATGISGMGTAALSVFLSLLFLRTNSVWLAAGVRVGLMLTAALMGLNAGDVAAGLRGGSGIAARGGDTGLLLLFGIPAAILLWQEISRMRRVRRPGPRGGQKVVYGKTVRGPWGPH